MHHDHPTRLVLLGHPVAHSLSPLFQNAALRSAGLNATYDALDVTAGALPGVLRELARAGVAGNVTVPHKEAMAAACTRTTELAARVGAVNTFWHEKGALVGHNTDVAGAQAAIAALLDDPAVPTSDASEGRRPRAGMPPRVAILGAGGAAAAVIVALETFAPVEITVAARTPSRAHALAERLGTELTVVESAETAVHLADLVINCTPVGLSDDAMPVAVEALAPGACVLDLVPRAGETAWVHACRAAGHRTEDGARMLIEQGAAAFECWFGMVPDRASMWRALKSRPGPRAERPGNSGAAPRAP